MKSTSWDVVKVFDETNDILETWSSLFCDVVDKHPLIRKHRVRYKQQPDWLTVNIIEAIKSRDRFKSINNQYKYKLWRNKVIKMIKLSKKQQYSEIVHDNTNNPASIWKLFKELNASKRNTGNSILSIKINETLFENASDSASAFSKFFVSVVSDIKEPILPSNFDQLKLFCDENLSDNATFS